MYRRPGATAPIHDRASLRRESRAPPTTKPSAAGTACFIMSPCVRCVGGGRIDEMRGYAKLLLSRMVVDHRVSASDPLRPQRKFRATPP